MAAEHPVWRRVWGEASALLGRTRKGGWVDLLLVAGLVGLVVGLTGVVGEWRGPHRAAVEIDLSPWALPRYTFYSLTRGLLAYGLSLGFTLVYGYWAAKDALADRVLIPLLDVLQSIPVLAFLPGLVLALGAAFPASNAGLELASILMIFTGQAWNMTFSFYHALRSLPGDQAEAATAFRFSWWERLRWVELPYATVGLVWNSMLSVAGGWFFLVISEAYRLGDQDFRLPGLGAYVSVAVDQGRADALLWAVLAMAAMILALDQLVWRPVVVWSQKFRVEESSRQVTTSSWFLTWLRRSALLAAVKERLRRWREKRAPATVAPALRAPAAGPAPWAAWLARGAFALLLATLLYGAWQLGRLLLEVPTADWEELASAAGVTLGRVLLSTAVGTLWAVPAGLAIGRSSWLARALQPVVQLLASFPAPMIFPVLIAGLTWAGVPLGWGSILLMLLGTQWYILFNVVAGATAIPADLAEAAHEFRFTGWRRFWALDLPAVFPYLVTGWVTAAGGAWNTSIVAEYLTFRSEVFETWGLGALIQRATEQAQFPQLAAGVLVMAVVVVGFNRTVWRRLHLLAERRFSLTR